MRYTQLTEPDVRTMLGTIGAGSVDDLFSVIPDEQKLNRALDLPAGLSEMELLADLERLAGANADCTSQVCFLGAGSYDHFIPTVVDALAAQGSFLTGYTPYQAEASQGSLQAFYEFQTLICQLTGLDVANASLYEGASAAAEAVLMARNVTGRNKIVVSGAVSPETLAVLRTYIGRLAVELVVCPADAGVTDMDALSSMVDGDTAAVVVQSPNFFGCVERVDAASASAKQAGALSVAIFDPIACALLKPPGLLGADVAVGEGQSLGNPMNLGGPYLGLMAVRQKYMRKMPGRLVGMTQDAVGRRAYCLTLQTREQHIRREKATSNVCTNQGLLAIRSVIYMSLMGRLGMKKAASLCVDGAHYAAERIASLPGFAQRFEAPFFKEFVVRTDRDVDRVLSHCRERGILAGVPLGQWYEEMADCFLVAVTEKRTKEQLDALIEALATSPK